MKAMRRKSQALPLVRGKDDCGYCHEYQINCCGNCRWRKRCKLLCVVEISVTNDNGSNSYWPVVVEAYRSKSAKYALWKHLDRSWATASDGCPLCYSMAEALGFGSFVEFARQSRVNTMTRLLSPHFLSERIDGTLKPKDNAKEGH